MAIRGYTRGLSEKQLEVRRTRFTGSTVGEYLGYSPYRSPSQAWRMARGLEEFRVTEDMEGGQYLEEGIAEMILHRLGIPIEEAHQPDSLFHMKHPEAIVVHLDLLIPSEHTGIQIKNHNPWVARTYKGRPGEAGKWDNELVPRHANMQCQLEMEVARSIYPGIAVGEFWILAPHFSGGDVRAYFIRRHPRLIRGMLEAGRAFWKKHLDPNGPRLQPDDRNWIGPAGKPRRRPKMTVEELAAAPIPF